MIPTPIRSDEIHTPVAIEIAAGDSLPPAGQEVESRKLRVEGRTNERWVPGCECAPVVPKDLERTPFTGQRQYRPAVAVEIGEHGAVDQTETSESRGANCIQFQ